MTPVTNTPASSPSETTVEPADLVLHLTADGADDVRLSGAKAGRLAQLTRAGFAVPRGFVISSAAAQAFARMNGITASTPADHGRGAAIPPDVETRIRRALEAFGDMPVAVRSSSAAEDLASASFAGVYESILDVSGPEAVLDAVRRVWASAHDARVRSYQADAAGCAAMSVLVQEMVRADVAGVAFSADPVTGDRDVVVVSAVRGVGERLVSGTASAEEWRVKGSQPTRLRNDDVLNVETVLRVAELARRLESLAGAPQDIEWAVEQGQLRLLQARPLTAVPAAVTWSVPWGGWVRNFRLGEWIGDPVTPSFESWLLTGIEEGMHGHIERLTGWPMPRPFHCIVNGWYYYGLNLLEPGTSRMQVLARVPTIVGRVSRNLRAVAGITPPTARLGFDWGVREWREQLLPATEALVQLADPAVKSAPVTDLVGWIDRLAANAGRNFASVIGVSGYSAKAEFPLARFWARHLGGIEGSWLELVRSGDAAAPAAHDVQSLDWFHPTLGELTHTAARPHAKVRERIVRDRDALTKRATEALAGTPKLQRQFMALLEEAQRAHVIREEQSRSMTLAWPALRVAILRIGDALVSRGALASREQVFFLKRDEIQKALTTTQSVGLAAQAAARREGWNRQRALQAPLVLGELPGIFKDAFAQVEQALFEGRPQDAGEIRGMPGSPGRATGPVKIIRSVEDVSRLRPGDVLVTPVTTPAWTPAFAIVAAVVTDTGSVASHASVVAREYGIPAVVGTGDATTQLRDGDIVTVDGAKATVRVLQAIGSSSEPGEELLRRSS